MALCPGKHPLHRHEEGSLLPGGPVLRPCLHPPRSGPAGPQLGPCCGTCWVTAPLPPPAPLWGAWLSPSGCRDPRDGCAGPASPAPLHHAWPSAPARSTESLGSADPSPSAGSPPAPPCPGAEEEALSTTLPLCRLSASASTAIDRRSFLATGLAAELLEELLSRRLPAPRPEQDGGSPEERCCASITASPSLERLRRHNQGFQRAMESFRDPARVALEAPGCPGQRWCQAQHRGHPCCDPAWHVAHGCCARVEPVPGIGHQRGPKPGPTAPTRSETSSARQRHKHRSGTRDAHPAPGAGTIVSHELQQGWRGTRAAARAGKEPQWEPELSRQPCGQEGLAVSLQCHDGQVEPGPGCGCGCALALKTPPQDMGWMQQEQEVLVPRSCCQQPCAAGATNMVQVIARSFELWARQDPRVPLAVPGPAQTWCGQAGACDGARCGACS